MFIYIYIYLNQSRVLLYAYQRSGQRPGHVFGFQERKKYVRTNVTLRVIVARAHIATGRRSRRKFREDNEREQLFLWRLRAVDFGLMTDVPDRVVRGNSTADDALPGS